jgi:hypothetical protein
MMNQWTPSVLTKQCHSDDSSQMSIVMKIDAQDRWIENVLRAASGAAIAQCSEYANHTDSNVLPNTWRRTESQGTQTGDESNEGAGSPIEKCGTSPNPRGTPTSKQ